jgi:1-acyl-sn-glycerol-3-phosphate acyltransferase
MHVERHYVPRNSRAFNKLIKLFYGTWLRLVYRVRSQGEDLFATLRPPYVIVGNHVTTRDPFIVGTFCPEPVYWVTSDGNLRTRFMRFFLHLVGSIPKAKSIPDLTTVSWMVDVVRKRKGVVGIFPEGQQSWDGHTLPLAPATGKLVKLLKVPVVLARLEGAYFALPRWTWVRRRGRVDLAWSLLLSADEVASLSPEEIFARLEAGLDCDAYDHQESARVAFIGGRRAEHLELALFMCPECEAAGGLRSLGKRLHCSSCGSAFILDRFGYLRTAGKDRTRFSTIREWNLWQTKAFADAAEEAQSHEEEAFIVDSGAVIFRGRRMNPLRRIRAGNLALYPGRLELTSLAGERIAFPTAELDGIGVLKRNFLEFYRGKELYQVRFARRSVSARKWADALQLFAKAGRARSKM